MATRVTPRSATSPASKDSLSSEWTAVLGEVPLFSGLNRRHLARVARIGRLKRFTRASRIVTAGDPGDAFYVILDGTASVRAGGRKVRIMGTGDFFGEMALLDGAPRSATVVADSDVATVAIPRAAFLKLLNSEPKITIGLLEALSQRVRALQAVGTL